MKFENCDWRDVHKKGDVSIRDDCIFVLSTKNGHLEIWNNKIMVVPGSVFCKGKRIGGDFTYRKSPK